MLLFLAKHEAQQQYKHNVIKQFTPETRNNENGVSCSQTVRLCIKLSPSPTW